MTSQLASMWMSIPKIRPILHDTFIDASFFKPWID
jgi:hypothetical protein